MNKYLICLVTLSSFAFSGSYLPGQERELKESDSTKPDLATRKKTILFSSMSSHLGVQPEELSQALILQNKKKNQHINFLAECIGIEPTSRNEEIIAENAAILLSRYRGADVIWPLVRNIDLDTRRHVKIERLSSESMVSPLLRSYPCLRSTIEHGEQAVAPLIEISVSNVRRRSDLQLELAALALLEIRCPKMAIPQLTREKLIAHVDRLQGELKKKLSLDEESAAIFRRFLHQVEPSYYLYPRSRKNSGLEPAKGSALFDNKTIESTKKQ